MSPRTSHCRCASTIVLYLTLLAGFAGLRAGASDGDLGATVEWRTPPLRPGAYVSGRFAGVLAACLILFVALVAFLAAGEIEELREHPPDVAATVLVCAGGLLTAAQFAALGIMLACLTTRQFAAILFAATLVATRTVVPELASHHGVSAALAALLPDPTRLDLTREFAFHRPVDGLATTAAIGCSALQSAACLCVAEWALRRRET